MGALYFDRTFNGLTNLKINEFMASNSSGITDEFGEFEDWIEIYNPGNNDIDLSNLYLTDDFNQPTLWQIPKPTSETTTIPSKGYVLFWADNYLSRIQMGESNGK